MPEIKNNFAQGKMNKDLDERLIPNGQYRHALNVEVSTSESSNSGTIQNILGNAVAGQLAIGEGYTCVGSLSDEKNNKIYWLVKGDTRDLILEYNHETKTSQCILVDIFTAPSVEPFLKFTGKKITGINIVDSFLYWTDGDNEPKKVNIKTAPNQFHPADSVSHQSKLYVNNVELGNLIEEHITVIKRAPRYAPLLKINTVTGSDAPIFEKTFPRFCIRYKYRDGEYSPFGPFTDVVFNTSGNNANTAYNTKDSYNTAMSNNISSIDVIGFVRDDIPKDVVEIDILYKQEDSTVIYSVASIKKTDDEWNTISNSIGIQNQTTSGNVENEMKVRGSYKISTENVKSALPSNQFLRPWDNVPRKALSQEITGNRLVYGNYTQGYDFTNKPKVYGGFESRNILKKGPLPSLKSQRDYQLGVVYGDKYGRETPVFTSSSASVSLGWSSVQAGGEHASNPTSLTAALQGFSGFPDWVNYYKFYVKQTSGEYYNVLMDSAYTPAKTDTFKNEENHVWISLPSSDRNKIEDQDYIIMKRAINGDSVGQVITENKYKVLGISNEAPDSISYAFHSLGSIANTSNLLNDIFDADPSQAANQRIDIAGQTVITIDKQEWTDPSNNGTILSSHFNHENRDLHMSWKLINGDSSSRYSISSITEASGIYTLTLANTISEIDANIAHINNNSLTGADPQANLKDNLIFNIERKDKVDGENFSGKFFVKILSDDLLQQYVLSETLNIDFQDYILASASTFYMADKLNSNTNSGISNSSNANFIGQYIGNSDVTEPHEINGLNLTSTAAAWEGLTYQALDIDRGFFIDAMYMAASNPSSSSYAKEAGVGWVGESANVNYPEVVWSHSSGNTSVGFGLAAGQWGWRLLDTPISQFSVDALDIELYDVSGTSNHPTVDDGEADTIVVNGLEGIIEANNVHEIDRQWAQDSIYGTRQGDNTYQLGGFYVHLSYLSPGADLHNGNIPNDVTINGENGIAKYLQGIWGGGVFSNLDGSSLGASTIQFVEMESNPNSVGDNSEESNPGTPSQYNGYGYDENYFSLHNGQWKPTYVNPSSSIESFINNMAQGNSFRFLEDTSETTYEIISEVKQKHIYNHTSWRNMYGFDGSSIFSKSDIYPSPNDSHSVERAVLAWANTADVDGVPNNSGNDFTRMKTALTNFGSSSNRRTCYIMQVNNNPTESTTYNPMEGGDTSVTSGGAQLPDSITPTTVQFVSTNNQVATGEITKTPLIWEVEPTNNVELDVYYEAGDAIPVRLTEKNQNIFAPEGCRLDVPFIPNTGTENVYLRRWVDDPGTFEVREQGGGETGFSAAANYVGATIRFYRENGGYTSGVITEATAYINTPTAIEFLKIETEIDPSNQVGLSWFNCFNFKNGIESNRIRDDFNTMQITNGAKASATLEEPYIEEQRKNGLIYSGIYNSNSATNNLNQFVMAEKITKDLNPTYGSIQKLFSRNTDLIAFCEDRIIKIVANKDALFNADGNPQLISSSNVLGQAVPFSGDYGISKNPESFASESYRAYFTDKQRGAVLRLSMDGLTPISNAGMHDHFRDSLQELDIDCIGTYDSYKKQYNLTLSETYKLNLIKNSYVQYGSALSSVNEGQELALNTDLGGGINYSVAELPPFDAYGHNDYGGDDAMPISNRSFSHKVKLKHHPAISTYYTGGDPQLAWVEVKYYYESGLEWTTNNSTDTNLFWEAEQIYGIQNPGEVGGQLGSGQNWYINPGTNNSNVYDSAIGTTAQGANPSVPGEYYGEEEINFNGKIKLEKIGQNDLYVGANLKHTLDGGVNFITGEWYMVDILYDQADQDENLVAPIMQYVLGSSDTIDQARINNSDHTSGDDNYPEFSFGRVAGPNTLSSNKSMQTFPVGSDKYRAIFQYDSNGSSDDLFKLEVYNGSFVASTIMLYKISPGSSMTYPSNWLTNDYNWQSPHYMVDFINENTPFNAYPNVYYYGNKLCFDTPANVSGTYWNQGGNNALWMPASSDAVSYTLRFKVQPLADGTPYNSEVLTGSAKAIVSNGSGQGLVLNNIEAAGDYEVDFYFNNSQPLIKEQPLGSNILVESAINSADGINYNSLQFRVNTSTGFTGAVSNVSVKESNYFTGGAVDNWTFSGFDTVIDDDIFWSQQDEKFTFNVTDGVSNPVQIEQHIGNLLDLKKYSLTLTNQLTSGSLHGYYFNSDNKGFRFGFSSTASNSNYSVQAVMQSIPSYGGIGARQANELQETLVIYTRDNAEVQGQIDNIVLKIVPHSKENATVSYSEDVNGWVSFKSFVPENGVSLSKNYFTMKNGTLYQHYTNEVYNQFYNNKYDSTVTAVLNQSPSSVKSFNNLSYEGSISKAIPVRSHTLESGEVISNINPSNAVVSADAKGWYASSLVTDIESGYVEEFIKKEGKWFNYIKGIETNKKSSNGISGMNFQGLGFVLSVED